MTIGPAIEVSEILAFLEANVEPLIRAPGLQQYRAGAHLTDGTHLPCVNFESEDWHVNRVMEIFEQERRRGKYKHEGRVGSFYEAAVRTYVAKVSVVPYFDIGQVGLSPFAWPLRLLDQIQGETTMGTTAFVAEMHDGRRFSYEIGSMGERAFFDFPDGYQISDIRRIHSHMVYSDAFGMEDFRKSTHYDSIEFHHEMPCFSCLLPGL